MKVSISVTDFDWPDGIDRNLARIAQVADESALDTLWVADHLVQSAPGSTPDGAMLEAFTTLGCLAGRTNRIRLGAMVAAVSYRAPSLLIKAVTTLDALSGGRAWFGIGAGYQQDEAAAMGLDLPPVADRFEQLEETVRLAQQMWSGDAAPFEGKHFQLTRPVGNPLPVRRPPILIGGTGERKTLPLVARYADACNVFDIPDGGKTVRHKLSVLERACNAIGRPFDAIEKTIGTRIAPDLSSGQFAQRCGELSEMGIDHMVVVTSGPWQERDVARLGELAADQRAIAGRMCGATIGRSL